MPRKEYLNTAAGKAYDAKRKAERNTPAGRRAAAKAWRKFILSAKGKAWKKETALRSQLRRKTKEFKERWNRYQNSPKRKAWTKKYEQSAKCKAARTARAKTPLGRARSVARQATYRAKQLNIPGQWTGAQFFALCKKYGNVCLCCGKKGKLTADHVVPLSKGGTNYFSNIQPLLLPCNLKKGNKTTDYRLSMTQKRPQGVASQLRKAA